jgi:hypothetical protein
MKGKGQTKTGVRRKGTPNKVSELVKNKLDQFECYPAEPLEIIVRETLDKKDL